jgi:hypothetical protein
MKQDGLKVGSLQWRTARRSAGNGACVEVAPAGGQVLVRDSQNKTGPVVMYPGRSWRAFLSGVKDGQFGLDRL